MRTFLAVALVATSASAQAESRRSLGVGIALGAPSGLSLKAKLDGSFAIQGGLGVIEAWGDEGIHTFVDLVWNPLVLTRRPAFNVPLYFGLGGRLLRHDSDWYRRESEGDGDDTHLGIRAPVGVLLDFTRVPLDLFAEGALSIDLVHLESPEGPQHEHKSMDVYFTLGDRFYF